MKFAFAATLALLASANAALIRRDPDLIEAQRDATVSYNGRTLSDGSYEALMPKGLDTSLVAFRGAYDYRRILVGFDLPADATADRQIAKCVLHIPRPATADSGYELAVFAAEGEWDESTVNAQTELKTGENLGSSSADEDGVPGEVDVTDACRAADADGRFGVFVDSDGPIVAFKSIQGGGDRFKVDVTYN